MCLADRFYCYWSVQKIHPLYKFKFQLSWHHGLCFLNVWCHKTGDSLFPPSDTGTQDAVCVSWTDLFMLLATVVRRDSSAAYPSVSAALGRRWRPFAGMQKFLFVCVQVTELFTVLCTAYIWHLRFHKLYFKDIDLKTLVSATMYWNCPRIFREAKIFHFRWSPIYFGRKTVENSFSFTMMNLTGGFIYSCLISMYLPCPAPDASRDL